MRKKVFPFILLALITACKPKEHSVTAITAPAPAPEHYSYSIDRPDNWDINTDPRNTAVSLKSVKAFELGTADSSLQFADVVEINSDNFSFKGSNAAAAAIIKKNRRLSKRMKIQMHNWVSVISKDKQEEWVTLWYTTTATDRNNKTNAASYISDLKLSNGKITQLDTYTKRIAR